MSDEISSLYQVEVIPTARREAANAAAARGEQRRPRTAATVAPFGPCWCAASFWGWCGNRVRTRQSASGGAPPCGLRLAPPDGGCKAKNVCASPRKAACSGAAFYPRRHGGLHCDAGRRTAPAPANRRHPPTPCFSPYQVHKRTRKARVEMNAAGEAPLLFPPFRASRSFLPPFGEWAPCEAFSGARQD